VIKASKRILEDSHKNMVVTPRNHPRQSREKCRNGRKTVHDPRRKCALNGRRNVGNTGRLYNTGRAKRARPKTTAENGAVRVVNSIATSKDSKMSTGVYGLLRGGNSNAVFNMCLA
jgi:hypothetical protein